MICPMCGASLEKIVTDLPFKVEQDSIVILKALPVLQCLHCQTFLLEDPILAKVDEILNKIDKTAELEILKFAV